MPSLYAPPWPWQPPDIDPETGLPYDLGPPQMAPIPTDYPDYGPGVPPIPADYPDYGPGVPTSQPMPLPGPSPEPMGEPPPNLGQQAAQFGLDALGRALPAAEALWNGPQGMPIHAPWEPNPNLLRAHFGMPLDLPPGYGEDPYKASLEKPHDWTPADLTSGLLGLSAMPQSPEQRFMSVAQLGVPFPAVEGAAMALKPVVGPLARRAGEAMGPVLKRAGEVVGRGGELDQKMLPILADETGALRLGRQPPAALGAEEAKAQAMFKAADEAKPPGPTLAERYRGWQERVTDEYAGINQMQAEAQKAWDVAHPGVPLPLEQQVETLAALSRGGPTAGFQRAKDMAREVEAAIGPRWDTAKADLDNFLFAQRQLEIRAAKGPQRKVPGALQPDVILQDIEGRLDPNQWISLQNAAGVVVKAKADQLERMVQSGLVSRELADLLQTQYPWYSPTRVVSHVLEQFDSAAGAGGKKLSVTKNDIKRLTEEGTEGLVYRPTDSMIESLVRGEQLIARNDAARGIGQLAVDQGIGVPVSGVRKVATIPPTPPVQVGVPGHTVTLPGEPAQAIYRRPPGEIPGTMSYMDGGKRVVVAVPKWLETEAKLIGSAANPEGVLNWLSKVNQISRAGLVTYNPGWWVGNFFADYMTAGIRGVLPQEEARGLVGAIRNAVDHDPVLGELYRRGGGQAGIIGEKTPADVAKQAAAAGAHILQEKDLTGLLNPRWVLDVMKTTGQVIEDATRRALFTTALKRRGMAVVEGKADPFLPNAGMSATDINRVFAEAALETRRGTIDFQRMGSFTRQANQAILFLNAGLHGMLMPARVLRDSPESRMVIGGLSAINLGLYAYNRQFSEYLDVPRDIRYGSVVLMLPSVEQDKLTGKAKPHYVTIIPRMREWSMIFGAQTYLFEKIDGKASPAFGQFMATVVPQSLPVTGAAGIIPTQLGQTAVEQTANYDFYRNNPIVPPELSGKPAGQQFDQFTSESLRRVGEAWNLSPLRLQHELSNVLGGGGREMLAVADFLVRHADPKDTAKAQSMLDQLQAYGDDQLARREYINSLPQEDQTALEALARAPRERLPIISNILDRFVRNRSGEIARLGRELAEAKTGKSSIQTTEVAKEMGAFADVERTAQEQRDAELLKRAGNPEAIKAWRDAQGEKANRYQGLLQQLNIRYPGAAQLGNRAKWQEYQQAVYSLAGLVPDRRDRGQFLAAGYHAIPLEQSDPLTKDFDTFQERRDEFIAALDPDDRQTLQRALAAGRTALERDYAADRETMRAYFRVKDAIVMKMPGLAEEVRKHDGADLEEQKKIERGILWRTYERQLKAEHDRLRDYPDIEQAGERWGYFGPRKPPGSLPELPLAPLMPVMPRAPR